MIVTRRINIEITIYNNIVKRLCGNKSFKLTKTVKKCTVGLGGPVISRYNYTQVDDKSLIIIIIIQGIIYY